MPHYLIAMCPPPAGSAPPSDEELGSIMTRITEVKDEIAAAGSWVFGGGLDDADLSTVLRKQGDEVVVTDGPFAEGKEHIGGLSIVQADDLDVVLGWARRFADISGLPVEVRPFMGVQ